MLISTTLIISTMILSSTKELETNEIYMKFSSFEACKATQQELKIELDELNDDEIVGYSLECRQDK